MLCSPRLSHSDAPGGQKKMKTKHSMSSNSSTLTCTTLTFFTVAAVIVQLVGLCIFIMGFFPVKPTLAGMSGLESFYPPGSDPADLVHDISSLPPEQLKSLFQELSGVPPLFDRLILMVIDGFPAEFLLGKDGKPPPKVFKEAMPYTMSLLSKGTAIGYHAKATPPTVTMPRLKAMVSGAIGGFLDVAFNFNTQAFLDDNLIAQFLRFGWKMVMLGDETWLKLFPGMFTRHDGVSSFFVKDTVEVDHNISRHLTDELNRTDWDLLILHYLGLDHVGHIGGRNSVLMGPKLMEMDEVIKRIHSSIITETRETNKRTLLMIVSDHGMTEGGNHGGSSFEETDSLAVFVGAEKLSAAAEINNKAYQVDIAVTLAFLFAMPIPRNNVGTVMAEVFTSLKEEQQLRILQLNSWQLMRLLQTHLPDWGCERVSCFSKSERDDGRERFCCSYLSAVTSHESWKSRNFSRSGNGDDYRSISSAYDHFLTTASVWLSSRATDKPIVHLASGIGAMLVSCLVLVTLFLYYDKEVNGKHKWPLEEYFTLAVILILVLSMGSSSMIEEEQYIWHFMTSSLYLILLRKSLQHFTSGISHPSLSSQKTRNYHQMHYIVSVLIFGRILRAWHQGGVNWSHIPDVAKLLDKAGPIFLKSLQLLSLILVVFICLAVLFALRLKICVIVTLMMIYLFPVLLILKQIYQDSTYASPTTIQTIYAFLGISTLSVFFATPWLMPLKHDKTRRISSEASYESQRKFLLGGFRDSMHVIGWCYIFSWCLLQLLLQQAVNAIPVALFLVQILGSIQYFSDCNVHLKKWVKVSALYYIGMEGHFGLGNTNTLATIDVAGGFMGISSHSTMISGILMFIITYASPILAILSMLMDVDDLSAFADNVCFGHLLKITVGYTCLVPLALNSILLLAYTIVLLLMQNHLFIWSVFSPKYLYVCATTACVYIGVSIVSLSAAYTCMVFAVRSRLKSSC